MRAPDEPDCGASGSVNARKGSVGFEGFRKGSEKEYEPFPLSVILFFMLEGFRRVA